MKSTLSDKKSRYKKIKTAVKFANQFAKGDVLDVGSRDGFAVHYFKKLGNKAVGIEMVDDWAQYAKSVGRNVISGNFMDTEINQKFDLIYSRHSLEHFKEPLKMLEKSRGLLKPGGVIVAFIPLQDEKHSSSKTHLSFFPTIKHLTDMVELAGFTVKTSGRSRKKGLLAKSDEAYVVGANE